MVNKDEKILHLTRENEQLKYEMAQLRRLIFSSKTERFVANAIAPHQGTLFAEDTDSPEKDAEKDAEQEKQDTTEEISYKRKKTNNTKGTHAGRNKIPEHLPTQEIIIEPDEDTTGMKKIGEEITETLEYTPASLVKKITRRPKYATADKTKILIGQLPTRPIEKGIAEASLLAHIFVQKFIDHLPFYRQRQIFKRNYDWDLPSSTINDWFIACCTLLKPLYDLLVKKLLENSYLQADESPIRVLENDKPADRKGGKGSHQGYMWVYRSPCKAIVIFQYRKGRGANGPKEMLVNHKGHLQTDGYIVYDKIAKSGNFELVGCWAHARRKFFESLKFDRQRAEFVLEKIKTIYSHEKQSEDLTAEARKEYRLENTAPLMEELHTWAGDEQYKVLPKTPIGKAIGYLLKQWKKLSRVLESGKLEMDNNRIENKIRPLALGRKNYLFAGNHKGGQNIAMMYSFFATCKEHQVNPYEWLKEVLEKIPDTKISELENLLPQNWTANPKASSK